RGIALHRDHVDGYGFLDALNRRLSAARRADAGLALAPRDGVPARLQRARLLDHGEARAVSTHAARADSRIHRSSDQHRGNGGNVGQGPGFRTQVVSHRPHRGLTALRMAGGQTRGGTPTRTGAARMTTASRAKTAVA